LQIEEILLNLLVVTEYSWKCPTFTACSFALKPFEQKTWTKSLVCET